MTGAGTNPRALGAVLSVLTAVAVGAAPAGAQRTEHEQPPASAPAVQMPAPRDANDHSPHRQPATRERPPFIPPVTDDVRAAAFPQDVEGHTVHDQSINSYVLFDQLEWQSGDGGSGLNVEVKGWLGRDRDRLWFRAEGDGQDGRVGEAEAHVLFGRQFSRWWDVVAGVRQDFAPGPARTWAAVGIQGLAPYWFEVELTGYVGESGRTHLRGEVEYELLLTNRLVLQPRVDVNLFGKSDPERGIGGGFGTTEVGFRVRYEFKRELAPYAGVAWTTTWGGTADSAKAARRAADETGGARVVGGLRLWF